MSDLEARSFESPDEVREFEHHGHIDLVKLHGEPIGKGVFEPGWRWSEDVKPMAGTDSCEVKHVGYVVSGRMKIVSDHGDELEIKPGDAFVLEPGHDAWTVGNEPCVLMDFGGLSGYAEHHH
jgi:hypothetical protein